jgi:hypothetical protein
MKHALFTAVVVAGLAIAAIGFAQESEELAVDLIASPKPTLELARPAQSIEERLREIDIKLALEQYENIQRMAQRLGFELMEMTMSEVKDDSEFADLKRRASLWSKHADRIREHISEKYGE